MQPGIRRQIPKEGKSILKKWYFYACFFTIASLASIVFCTVSFSQRPQPQSGIFLQQSQKGQEFTKELTQAWNLYFTARTAEAIEIFDEVLENEKSNPAEKAQSLFGLGTCYSLGVGYHDKPKALEFYTQLARQHPDNPAAPWALMRIGALYDISIEKERRSSREVFTAIIQDYPQSTAIHEAVLRLSATWFRELDSEQIQKGITLLEEHLETYPQNPLASIMHFRLAYWYASVEKDYKKSLVHRLKLAEFKMSDPHRWALQYWGIAQTYRLKTQEYDKALYWYRKLIEECPRDLLNFPAQLMIKKIEEELDAKKDSEK